MMDRYFIAPVCGRVLMGVCLMMSLIVAHVPIRVVVWWRSD